MANNGEWNEQLFGCCDDLGSCCYGYWCLPCLFGSNTEKIDDSNCVLMCCAYCCLAQCYLCWIPHWLKREKLRNKFGLKEDPCGDCPVTLFCGPCAVCQEAREMKSRDRSPGVRGGDPAVVYQPGAPPKIVQQETNRM